MTTILSDNTTSKAIVNKDNKANKDDNSEIIEKLANSQKY